ncbi:MAG: hypothetical protein QXJ75_01280 [Candidatus Bathyarchaeia archaeon]
MANSRILFDRRSSKMTLPINPTATAMRTITNLTASVNPIEAVMNKLANREISTNAGDIRPASRIRFIE